MPLSPVRAMLLAATIGLACVPAGPSVGREAPASFADLAARLQPAVVNVSSSSTVAEAASDHPGSDQSALPPGAPFDRFFDDFMNHQHGAPPRGGADAGAGPHKTQSLGSGFIVDPSGLVVTNNHVISGADEVTVTLADGTSLPAELVGKDERADIALLRVHPAGNLPAVLFGDSDHLRVGDWVMAIGNPFGLGGSVTAGILSARGRDIRQGPYDDFLQTDAAINRGNSGGPLFDMGGRVIGINTAIYSPSGGSIGIGFAIPATLARNVVAQLRDYGHPRRGWLGVRVQELTPDIADSVGLRTTGGALVAGVIADGPASHGPLRDGDVITRLGGQDVREARNLPRLVAETPIGQAVPVVLWRDGKSITVPVTVTEAPDRTMTAQPDGTAKAPVSAPAPGVAVLGLQLAPLTGEQRSQAGLGADGQGVAVTRAEGEAVAQGIKAGDVISELQQRPVATPEDARNRIDAARQAGRKTVLLLVQGGNGLRWVLLHLGAAAEPDARPGSIPPSGNGPPG